MKYLLALAILSLTACSTTVPVTAKFPEPPGKSAMSNCPQLEKLKDGAQLSDVATTISVNYGTYYECAVKNDAWIEWYSTQKFLFENAGKK